MSGNTDGCNCLYVLLALLGASERSYDRVAYCVGQTQDHTSCRQLLRAAQVLGKPLVAGKCNVRQLVDLNRPCIVVMENPLSAAGEFCILLDATSDEAVLFCGASASVRRVDMEAFRRSWTGVVLFHEKEARAGKAVLFGLGGALGGCAAVATIRSVARLRPINTRGAL